MDEPDGVLLERCRADQAPVRYVHHRASLQAPQKVKTGFETLKFDAPSSNYHYFDYAAGWPVREEALAAYVDAVRQYGNPGSVHQAGQRAHALLEESRERVARALHTDAKSVVFTASATEK